MMHGKILQSLDNIADLMYNDMRISKILHLTIKYIAFLHPGLLFE